MGTVHWHLTRSPNFVNCWTSIFVSLSLGFPKMFCGIAAGVPTSGLCWRQVLGWGEKEGKTRRYDPVPPLKQISYRMWRALKSPLKKKPQAFPAPNCISPITLICGKKMYKNKVSVKCYLLPLFYIYLKTGVKMSLARKDKSLFLSLLEKRMNNLVFLDIQLKVWVNSIISLVLNFCYYKNTCIMEKMCLTIKESVCLVLKAPG